MCCSRTTTQRTLCSSETPSFHTHYLCALAPAKALAFLCFRAFNLILIIPFAPSRLHALILPWFRASILLGLCTSMTSISSAPPPPRFCETAPLCLRARLLSCHLYFPSPELPCSNSSALAWICHHVSSHSEILNSSISILIGSVNLSTRIITIMGIQYIGLFSSRTFPALLSRSLQNSTSTTFSFLHMYNYRLFKSNAPEFRSTVL